MTKKSAKAAAVTSPTLGDPVTTTPAVEANLHPSLRDKGIFFLSSGFNPQMAKEVCTWILEANLSQNRQYEHLTLIINSPGGEVQSAFAIIDCIRGSKIPVHTVGLGMIASCGLLLFMAGHKGGRTLTPNTSILSHQWAWGSKGKEHELFAAVKEFDLTNDRIINHYKVCTGLDKKTIKQKLLPPQDVWLSAEQALELGLCDEIKLLYA
jgi:ATP-dependent Clp protease protease subunit